MGLIYLLKKIFFGNTYHQKNSYSKNHISPSYTPSYVPDINTDEFDTERKKIRHYSTEDEIRAFLTFLRRYGGGYIKYDHGRIIKHEFLGKEKGILKGIFFNVILPGKNFSDLLKEDFRLYLVGIGVNGLDEKPDYNSIRERSVSEKENNNLIRSSGHKAEKRVNDTLSYLLSPQDKLYKNITLEYNNSKREFDHIIISNNTVLILETKGFGISANLGTEKCILHISEDDNWQIEKNGNIKNLISPTEQIAAQKEIINGIFSDTHVIVEYILILPNPELVCDFHGMRDYKIMTLLDLSLNYRKMTEQVGTPASPLLTEKIEQHIIHDKRAV